MESGSNCDLTINNKTVESFIVEDRSHQRAIMEFLPKEATCFDNKFIYVQKRVGF